MTSLTDKVALVTGGSRGIGAAIAQRLAAEGAAVVLTYRQKAEEARKVAADIESSGGRAVVIQADNNDAATVEAAVAETLSAFGRLDILVNSAGIFRAAPLEELTLQDFDETLAVNLRAVFIATKAAAPRMVEGGRIISIGSNLAERVPGPGLAAYSASKAALIGLTKALARDLGPRGITVNLVHPGSTDTDMNPADGEHAEAQLALMAIPRFGAASDVADLVAWLAGPTARSVTGADFVIDGGANA